MNHALVVLACGGGPAWFGECAVPRAVRRSGRDHVQLVDVLEDAEHALRGPLAELVAELEAVRSHAADAAPLAAEAPAGDAVAQEPAGVRNRRLIDPR
jgi:hypothetical protein